MPMFRNKDNLFGVRKNYSSDMNDYAETPLTGEDVRPHAASSMTAQSEEITDHQHPPVQTPSFGNGPTTAAPTTAPNRQSGYENTDSDVDQDHDDHTESSVTEKIEDAASIVADKGREIKDAVLSKVEDTAKTDNADEEKKTPSKSISDVFNKNKSVSIETSTQSDHKSLVDNEVDHKYDLDDVSHTDTLTVVDESTDDDGLGDIFHDDPKDYVNPTVNSDTEQEVSDINTPLTEDDDRSDIASIHPDLRDSYTGDDNPFSDDEIPVVNEKIDTTVSDHTMNQTTSRVPSLLTFIGQSKESVKSALEPITRNHQVYLVDMTDSGDGRDYVPESAIESFITVSESGETSHPYDVTDMVHLIRNSASTKPFLILTGADDVLDKVYSVFDRGSVGVSVIAERVSDTVSEAYNNSVTVVVIAKSFGENLADFFSLVNSRE